LQVVALLALWKVAESRRTYCEDGCACVKTLGYETCLDVPKPVFHYRFEGDLKNAIDGVDATCDIGECGFAQGKFGGTSQALSLTSGRVKTPPISLSRYTVCIWMKASAAAVGWQTAVGHWNTGGLVMHLGLYENKLADFGLAAPVEGADSTRNKREWAGAFPASTWKHVCSISGSGTDARHELYLDGALVASNTRTEVVSVPYNLPLFVGDKGFGDTAINQFGGELDELRVYDTDLSAADIVKLYQLTS